MEKRFDNVEAIAEFVTKMCESYSMVFDQPLISTDGKLKVKRLRELHKDYASFEYPYTYWIVIRSRGVEGSEYKSECVARIEALNDVALCEIKVECLEEGLKVSWKKRKLMNF